MPVTATQTHVSITSEPPLQAIIVAGMLLDPTAFDGTTVGVSISGASLSDVIYRAKGV